MRQTIITLIIGLCLAAGLFVAGWITGRDRLQRQFDTVIAIEREQWADHERHLLGLRSESDRAAEQVARDLAEIQIRIQGLHVEYGSILGSGRSLRDQLRGLAGLFDILDEIIGGLGNSQGGGAAGGL